MTHNRPTQIAVRTAAANFRAAIEAAGEPCGEITHSVNRQEEAGFV